MAKTPINIRVDDADLENWKKRAEEAGMELSGWIRERCNQDGKDMREVLPIPVAERSAPAPDRSAKPKTHKYEPGSIAASVAERTKHELGCDCFQCVQADRFFRSQREK